MTKKLPVILGFLLAVIVKSYFAQYEFVGLLIVGFLVGLMAKDGAMGGMWHAAVAGALGTIVCAIIAVLIFTTGGTFLGGLFGGLVGFTISGVISLVAVIGYIIYYAIVMGITGAVGGAIAGKK